MSWSKCNATFFFSGLLNMRGNDIPFNPFFYSYTLLALDRIWQVNLLSHWYSYSELIPSVNYCNHRHCYSSFQRLFVHTKRLTEEIKVYLNSSCTLSYCVQLFEYETVREQLKTYLAELHVRVWVGTEYTNQALYELITPEVRHGSRNVQDYPQHYNIRSWPLHNLGRNLLKTELESERIIE